MQLAELGEYGYKTTPTLKWVEYYFKILTLNHFMGQIGIEYIPTILLGVIQIKSHQGYFAVFQKHIRFSADPN